MAFKTLTSIEDCREWVARPVEVYVDVNGRVRKTTAQGVIARYVARQKFGVIL